MPVAILGSHQVRNWKRLQFPRVTVIYGSAFRFDRVEHSTREQQQEAADYILDRTRELHSQLRLLGHRGSLAAARDRRRQDRQAEDERYAIAERERKQAEKRREEAAADGEDGAERQASSEPDGGEEVPTERDGQEEVGSGAEGQEEKQPEPQA